VVPGGAVVAEHSRAGEHLRDALDRTYLARRVPAARRAARREMTGVHLRRDQVRRRGLGIERVTVARLVGHEHGSAQIVRYEGKALEDRRIVRRDLRERRAEQVEEA